MKSARNKENSMNNIITNLIGQRVKINSSEKVGFIRYIREVGTKIITLEYGIAIENTEGDGELWGFVAGQFTVWPITKQGE